MQCASKLALGPKCFAAKRLRGLMQSGGARRGGQVS